MKVVINNCWGGFGLSKKALLELYKRGCPAIEADPPEEYFSGTKDWKAEYEKYTTGLWKDRPLFIMAPDGMMLSFKNHDGEYRSDPILVKVVEEMGDDAEDEYARLVIVEIPDNVDYEIDDYDGMESVHEKHRVWYGDE